MKYRRIRKKKYSYTIEKVEDLEKREKIKEVSRLLKHEHTCSRCGKKFNQIDTNTLKDDFCVDCIARALHILEKEENENKRKQQRKESEETK